MYSVRWGFPNGVDYDTPGPVAKGVRDCFPENIVRAVDVGIDPPTIGCPKQTAMCSSSSIAVMALDRLVIKETALARVTFFNNHYLDAY